MGHHTHTKKGHPVLEWIGWTRDPSFRGLNGPTPFKRESMHSNVPQEWIHEKENDDAVKPAGETHPTTTASRRASNPDDWEDITHISENENENKWWQKNRILLFSAGALILAVAVNVAVFILKEGKIDGSLL